MIFLCLRRPLSDFSLSSISSTWVKLPCLGRSLTRHSMIFLPKRSSDTFKYIWSRTSVWFLMRLRRRDYFLKVSLPLLQRTLSYILSVIVSRMSLSNLYSRERRGFCLCISLTLNTTFMNFYRSHEAVVMSSQSFVVVSYDYLAVSTSPVLLFFIVTLLAFSVILLSPSKQRRYFDTL
jgi:hypothetical protein